ncbi:PPC domain-containing DNA-binding protein [Alkalibacillus salilacus]|uniref:DNA-binding protein with PD1-like motif n=1 Tax=Alkalibacillus salilacus TaxID=284582 RepID=A0ABT9VAZ1_9BACI|nr:PPC domain-containing DNA-binding protein [Alkalibacillus salilacus]MDQ0158126.1 putative DNA-binding protein with PD1-like motif [Alkalibacillus salilacus]
MADIQSVYSSDGENIYGRLEKGDDLLEGILEVCDSHGISAGSFSCIGSLEKVGILQIGEKDGDIGYTEPIYINKPVEILSGTGFIGRDLEGEMDIHFHGLFVDINGQISGGHFIRGKNPTLVTMEFIVHTAKDVNLQRKTDESWNLPVFQFFQGDDY